MEYMIGNENFYIVSLFEIKCFRCVSCTTSGVNHLSEVNYEYNTYKYISQL